MSLKISPKDTSFHISITSLGIYLSLECLLNFLSNFYISPGLGKNFKFMEFTFLENTLTQGLFTYALPHIKLAPKFLLSRPRQKEITHSPRQYGFEYLFLPTAERGGGNYDLLYQSSVRKYEDNLKH